MTTTTITPNTITNHRNAINPHATFIPGNTAHIIDTHTHTTRPCTIITTAAVIHGTPGHEIVTPIVEVTDTHGTTRQFDRDRRTETTHRHLMLFTTFEHVAATTTGTRHR